MNNVDMEPTQPVYMCIYLHTHMHIYTHESIYVDLKCVHTETNIVELGPRDAQTDEGLDGAA